MSTELALMPSTAPAQYSRLECTKVRRLAGALRLALNIHPGSDLVMVLGHGGEKNNLEALETWVMRSLETHGLLPNRAALQPLLRKLEAYLTSWEADR